MYVCMYVCMCVGMYVRTYVCIIFFQQKQFLHGLIVNEIPKYPYRNFHQKPSKKVHTDRKQHHWLQQNTILKSCLQSNFFPVILDCIVLMIFSYSLIIITRIVI